MARLTSCARTHVHGGDRRTSGAAAAWGRPVPALERVFRPRGTKHAALRPPQSVPGGGPCADGQRGHSRPVRTRVPGPPSGRSVPREPTRPSACPLAFPPAAPQATSLAPDGRCPAPEASPGASARGHCGHCGPRPCSGSHAGSISVLFLTRPQRPRALLSTPGWPRGGWVLSPCVLLLFPDVFCILLPQTATPAGGADAETQAAPRPAGAVSA